MVTSAAGVLGFMGLMVGAASSVPTLFCTMLNACSNLQVVLIYSIMSPFAASGALWFGIHAARDKRINAKLRGYLSWYKPHNITFELAQEV